MNEKEKLRYVAALAAFIEAFERSYEEGKRQLAAGTAVPVRGVGAVFYIEVPRDEVLADRWAGYTVKFEEAGLTAALAWRRTGEAALDSREAHPNGAHATSTGKLRWTVTLNTSGTE